MKILHVTAGIQETCGVSCFVVETARAQKAAGHEVCIVTTVTCGYPVGDIDVRLLPDPTETDFVPDVVHIHSAWNMYVHKMAVWARRRNIPYVISPHGTLTPWALKYHWWKKLPALVLYQYNDLKKASAFHVTAQSEVEDIRRLGLKQPVAVAPLGVYISDDEKAVVRGNDFLFLSRIHPKKGLKMLLEAWSGIDKDIRGGRRVIIAGPDDIGHKAELKNFAASLGLSVTDFSDNLEFGKKNGQGGGEVAPDVYRRKLLECQSDVVFTGPVYSDAKKYLFSSARYFVLPSFSENFGGVVLEALAVGTPVITTTGTPWSELVSSDCGWWIAPEKDALSNTLLAAMTLPLSKYEAMSCCARDFVKDKYAWEKVALTVCDAYRGVLEEGKKK